MDSVTKSFRIILRCLPRNCIFFSLRALETFCGVKESWSSARRMETDILGKSCFKMNLSSEIGKTTRIIDLYCCMFTLPCSHRFHSSIFFVYLTHTAHNFLESLRRKANARNVSFGDSLRWPNYILNSVDKTKIYCRGTTTNVF